MFENKNIFLFDLDGTLLNIEVEEFLKYYFGALSAKFSDLCQSREKFIEVLSESTEKMVRNDGSKSNQEAFMEDFMEKIEIEDQAEIEKIKNRFDNFYENEFKNLAKHFDLNGQNPAEIIDFLKSKNKKLVLATNPLFPVEAIKARLSWVDIDPDDFIFLTHYENMSYAKPNPKYYQQILEKIDAKAENCLMIGNDLKEDAVASTVGIKTLIVKDNLIERKDSSFDTAWQGSLEDLKKLLESEL